MNSFKTFWKPMYTWAMLFLAGVMGMLEHRGDLSWRFWLPLLMAVLTGSAVVSTVWANVQKRSAGERAGEGV